MDDVAMAIRDDLKFNVVWINDELLEVNLLIAKRFLCLMTCAMESRFQAGLIVRSAHPTATTAAGRLDHYRITQFLCYLHRLILCLHDSIASGCNRHAGFACSATSGVLVAHCLHRARGRAYELDVAAFADLYEMRILREKTVAGMNRVDVADLRG